MAGSIADETEVIEGYEKITEIALKGKRALIDGNWQELGYLMNENHKIQDSLSYSGDKNNKLIKSALEGKANNFCKKLIIYAGNYSQM